MKAESNKIIKKKTNDSQYLINRLTSILDGTSEVEPSRISDAKRLMLTDLLNELLLRKN